MTNIFIEGLTATVIGMGIVFAVLAVLAYILSFFKLLNAQKPATEASEDAITEIEENDALNIESYDAADDNELVAVISAAVYAAMGSDCAGAVIKSITPVKSSRASYSPWNVTAKRDNQRGLY